MDKNSPIWKARYEEERAKRIEVEQALSRITMPLEGSNVGVVQFNIVTGEAWFNDTIFSIQGYTREEALNHPDYPQLFLPASVENSDFVHPEDRKIIAQARMKLLDEKETIHEAESRLLHKDGTWVWVENRGRIVERDEKGHPTKVVAVRKSIDRRKQAEQQAETRLIELEETKRQLDLAAKATHLGTWSWDIASGKGHISDEIKKMCGIGAGDSLSRELLEKLVHPDDREHILSLFGGGTTGERRTYEFRIITSSQEVRWLYGVGATVSPGSVHGVLLDISDQKLAEENLKKAKQEISDAQIRALRYQVNPHFLFNTLNSIATLILDEGEAKAEEMVLKLARFYRSTLQRDPMALVPLSEEIELQALYLDIEKVRFPDEIEVIYEVPPELLGAMVPCLILQPLVENSIKYGMRAAGSTMKIRIIARRIGQQFELIVEDDGRGSSKPKGTGTGLRVTAQRLAVAFGRRYSCETESLAPSGFRVTLRMPLRWDEYSRPVASDDFKGVYTHR